MSSQAVRTQESAIPAAGEWVADVAHSRVGFIARHLMVTKVRGAFKGYDVRATIGSEAADSSVAVEIRAESIETGDAKRDEHLRSADFLDVENHPVLAFRSTKVSRVGDSRLSIDGDLTIKGVARPVTLDAEFDGLVMDPWGREHAAFTAVAVIDREDFGLTWNVALETGGVLVGKKIQIEIELQLVPAS